jgi:hypothetical protein
MGKADRDTFTLPQENKDHYWIREESVVLRPRVLSYCSL